jgi:hypothetical protein
MGWIPHSSTYCQMRVGSYCYILLCQALKATASQGPVQAMFIRCGEPPGTFDWGLSLCPESSREVGGVDRW